MKLASALLSLSFLVGCGTVRQDLPDADSSTGDDVAAPPDAEVGPQPDPDAALPLPDAAPGTPDATPPSPDAALPPPDAALPACTCDETAPVCSPVDHSCAACAADGDCSLYGATPTCAPSGACVECVDNADCSGTSPVCDAAACRACAAGSECSSTECHLDTGACYGGGQLIYLSPSGDDANACTRTSKCRSFTRALEVATTARHTVTLAPGSYPSPTTTFTQSIDVLGHGATVVGELYNIGGTATYSDLVVEAIQGTLGCGSGATCEFRHVITNGAFGGNGTVTLEDVTGSGMIYSTHMITIRRSTFSGSTATALIFGGWDITNSVFARNARGPAFSSPVASLAHVFDNNTVADNGSAAIQGEVLDLTCFNGAGGSFRNNIVWSSFAPYPTSIVASGCPLTYSVVYTGAATPYPGTGNLLGNPAFVRMLPSGSLPADFHLTSTSIARDTADPANPLADDMDGEARPAGSRADIGADEYLP